MEAKIIFIFILSLVSIVFSANPFKYFQGCQCGIENISKRIINGSPVQASRYPWFVPIGNWTHLQCGGSLISDKHVLTAARCLHPLNVKRKSLRVILGGQTRYDFKKDYVRYPSQDIQSIKLHKGFRPGVLGNDIAIIELQNKIDFKKSTLRPVCLPNFDETDNLFAYGFGKQNKRMGSYSFDLSEGERMHEVQLDRISDEKCKRFFPPGTFDETLTMCTLNEGTKNGICNGDEGDPLSSRKDGRVYQVGIATRVHSTCLMNNEVFPTGFEKIGVHLPWIRENTVSGTFCKGPHHPFF